MWSPDINFYESNADFGCRKVLGMRSVTSYINNGSSLPCDKFYLSKNKCNKGSKIKKTLAIVGAALASGLLLAAAIKKKKTLKAKDIEKTGVFNKLKKLFSKKGKVTEALSEAKNG